MEETVDQAKNILVAYFSCGGKTGAVAKSLAEVTGGVLYEIIPETPYTKADLDWRDKQSRSSVEMNNPSFRPAISSEKGNMADYDVVFVGFPIWWYVAPTIVNTFLESYDFSGKTIVLFATSGGSGINRAPGHLRGSVSEATDLREGKLLNGNPSKDELVAWVESLEL